MALAFKFHEVHTVAGSIAGISLDAVAFDGIAGL